MSHLSNSDIHVRYNLPSHATVLIGREREIATLREWLLDGGTRLVTLTGPGGTGKTRVALAAAERVADLFGDGVWLVDLTSLREPDLVQPAIARSLGFTDQLGQPLERQLMSYLADSKLLLVLDNFEQVLPAGTGLSRLIASAPGLKVLVTSREPLQVSWEHEFPIPPLPVPDLSRPVPPEVLGAVASVALFVQRTQAVAPDFRLSEQNARTVAELCVRLDGLPLATELAAARSRVLPVDEILGRLSNRLAFLTGGARDQPARHRTLRAAIEWSYDLLTPAERALFRQLGLLVGTWSLAAAKAVVDPPGTSDEDGDAAQILLDGVGSLVDKNLVRMDAQVVGEVRFGMLETIREYAVDRLVAEGERPRIERRRALFLVELSEQAEAQFFGPQQHQWLDRPEREMDNIQAALTWSLSEPGGAELGLRMVGSLWPFWFLRGHQTEGREWLRKLMDAAEPSCIAPIVRAKALFAAGFLASLQAEYGVAIGLLEESLGLNHVLGSKAGSALCLMGLARVRRELGEARTARSTAEQGLEMARADGDRVMSGLLTITLADMYLELGELAGAGERYEEGLAVWRELGGQQGVAYALGGLGDVQRAQGRPTAARALYEESLALRRELADRPNTAIGLRQLGMIGLDLGDLVDARDRFIESLSLSRDLGNPRGIAFALEGLAAVALAEERSERAVRLAGAAHALRTATGTHSPPSWHAELARRLGPARHTLGRDRWMSSWLSGQALTLERAITLALAEAEPPPVIASPAIVKQLPVDELSKRELEIALLVAQGLTSRQMAERLIVTERTINTHLERIRDKLGVRSRAQITACVMRSGLSSSGRIGRTTDTPQTHVQ